MEEEFEGQIEEQAEELGVNLAPVFEDMAEKTLREFSPPTTANIQTRPAVNTWGEWIQAQACSHHHGSS